MPKGNFKDACGIGLCALALAGFGCSIYSKICDSKRRNKEENLKLEIKSEEARLDAKIRMKNKRLKSQGKK